MKALVPRIPEAGAFFEFKLAGARLRQMFVDRVDIVGFAAAEAEIRAERVGRLVNLRGEAKVDLTFTCARCGDDFDAVLRIPVRMVMSPRRDVAADLEEDVGAGFYDGDEIFLDDIVLEQIVLAAPNAFYCRPDCKGVCAVCRANLNDGPCQCGT
jgi:uncharacterized protein